MVTDPNKADDASRARREPLRLAVLGSGRWGRNFVRVLTELEQTELCQVLDPDPGARAVAARLAPDALLGNGLGQLLDRVEAVVVCTPTVDHVQHAEQILEQGKHVLVEKPIALKSERAQGLAQKARDSKLQLMVGHQLLFHPAFEGLLGLVETGQLGPVFAVRSERSGPIDTDKEQGVLWGYGPHDVSMILALVGSAAPTEVLARGELDRQSGQPVRAEVDLGFASGPRCSVHLSAANKSVRKLTVVFERGTAVFDDAVSPGELLVSERVAAGGDADQGPWERQQIQSFEPLARESLHFVRCLETGQQPLTGAAHACQVTDILELADRLVRAEGAALKAWD